MTTAEFTIHLSTALRIHNLTHALYDVLAAIALDQARRGFSTIPGVSILIGCTFQNVDLHLRRNPGLFEVNHSQAPRHILLSNEGINLLAGVSGTVNRLAEQPQAPA